MGHRAHYSFKFKNQYINNVYQHWGANQERAIAIAIALFSQNFKNMEQVVAFIEDKKLLDIAYLYETIKQYQGQSFLCTADKDDFITSLKTQQNVFDKQLKVIDYQQTATKKMTVNFDIEAAYLYDLDNKLLINTSNQQILLNKSLFKTQKLITKTTTCHLNCDCQQCYFEINNGDEN